MVTKHIDLRSDQLLYNHGPGSILESTKGPVVVNDFGALIGNIPRITNNSFTFPRDFEIVEPRLSGQLGRGIAGGPEPKLFRPPSNSEIDNERSYILATKFFPNWLICRNPAHVSGHFNLYQGGGDCPECTDDGFSSAIRFVKYCRRGHLDDVPWNGALHRGVGAICQNATFRWVETSSSMSGISIACNTCGVTKRLNQIAQSTTRCTGRNPEAERRDQAAERTDCAARAHVTLRQSSVLWQSSIKRVVTIPNTDAIPTLLMECLSSEISGRTDFDTLIQDGAHFNARNRTNLPSTVSPDNADSEGFLHYLQFLNRSPGRMRRNIERLMKISESSEINDVRNEYDRLVNRTEIISVVEAIKAECLGLVRDKDNRPTVDPPSPSRPIFRIENNAVSASLGRVNIVGEPVTTLRTVTALSGFYRGAINVDGEEDPTIVPTRINEDGQMWYPATDAFGEGILFWLSDNSQELNDSGERWTVWDNTHQDIVKQMMEDPSKASPLLYRGFSGVDPNDKENTSAALVETRPEFVWWHTFAHHLIRVVQAETGYSSSAIKERIYTVRRGDRWFSAVLLYVTEGGMSGTLGGLTSLLPNLQIYFDRLVEGAEVCSNDPLCEEMNAPVIPNIGCYACSMNPETSCEHRNLFIDRILMLEGIEP